MLSPLQAQETEEEAVRDSTEVEESDEAYRRRMELEDARQRDLGYTLPPETYAQEQEKLDKLPEESRNNIRDQLVDIIVENGDWEPSDALKDYPYEPTAAAQGNPELMQQEQEAWDEQIEKYHKREAAAFGTYLGPVPGPGNPDGEEGGGQEGAEAGGIGTRRRTAGSGARQETQQEGQDAIRGRHLRTLPVESRPSRMKRSARLVSSKVRWISSRGCKPADRHRHRQGRKPPGSKGQHPGLRPKPMRQTAQTPRRTHRLPQNPASRVQTWRNSWNSRNNPSLPKTRSKST